MPRAARYRIAALADLRRQLTYAPPDARRRHMLAAEALVEAIEEDRNYPEDYIIFRITGYRPDHPGPAATFVGAALVGDLVNLVQELSVTLPLHPDERDGAAVTLGDLADRLQVSTKTLQRYRKRGLVCHYVTFPVRGQRLACFDDAFRRFAQRHPRLVENASTFTRLARADEAAIIAAARRLREAEGLTLNRAARRLAVERRRSLETIRRTLRRHDRETEDPIFTERGPLDTGERELICRGWRRGVPITRLAEHVGRSKPTILRVVARGRAERLRGLDLAHVELPTFDLDDAEAVILAAPAVTAGLDELPPRGDALALVEWSRQAGDGVGIEVPLVAGLNFLKRRARADIEALPEHPTFGALDAIETRLRWAAALHRRLVALGLPAALRRVEANLHRPLERQSAEEIRGLVRLAADQTAIVVESVDPSRGHRLARRVAYALDRRLAREDVGSRAARAGARHAPGAVRMDDPLESLRPWAVAVEPHPRWRAVHTALDAELASALALRYGWGGRAPLSIPGLARALGASPRRTERLLARGEEALRVRIRSEHTNDLA